MVGTISEIETRLRRLWTIFLLLDGKEHKQQNIVKKLNEIDSYLEHYSNSKNVQMHITRSIESNILKYLEEEEVIKRESKDVINSNFKIKICRIPLEFTNFINIILEINNNYVNKNLERFYLASLINSVYGKKFINQEFIFDLLKMQEIPLIDLNKEERELITTVFQNSPLALNYTVNSIVNKEPEWETPNKKNFLIKILSYLNIDLLDFSEFSIYPLKIDLYMKYSFTNVNKELKNNKNNLKWENDYLKINFSDKKGCKGINCDEILKTYLKSCNAVLNITESDLMEELSEYIVFNKNLDKKSRTSQQIDKKDTL